MLESIHKSNVAGNYMLLILIAVLLKIKLVCLQFVRTDLALKVDSKMIEKMGGYVSMEAVVKGINFLYYYDVLTVT